MGISHHLFAPGLSGASFQPYSSGSDGAGTIAHASPQRPAPANHRGAGAGHRRQGSHHARSSAARAAVRRGNRKRSGAFGTGAGSSDSRGGAARYRKTGSSGIHHLQARQTDALRVREDEDPSGGGRGNSRTRRISVSGGSDCPLAPRKMGWQRLSLRSARRGNSHRRPNSVGRGLPGCISVGSPVSPGAAAGRGYGQGGIGSRHSFRSQSGSSFAEPLPLIGSARKDHQSSQPAATLGGYENNPRRRTRGRL